MDEASLHPLLAATLAQTKQLVDQSSSTATQLNTLRGTLSSELQRRQNDQARLKEEINGLKMGLDEFIGLTKREIARMTSDRDSTKKLEEKVKASRAVQIDLENQLSQLDSAHRKASSDLDNEKRETARLRRKIDDLESNHVKEVESVKRQVIGEAQRAQEHSAQSLPTADVTGLLTVIWQLTSHNDLLPEIFKVSENTFVQTIVSIANRVSKVVPTSYTLSTCIGILMNVAAAEWGRSFVLSRTSSCVPFAVDMLAIARSRNDRDLVWLVLCLISNMAVEQEGARQLSGVHLFPHLHMLVIDPMLEPKAQDKCAEIFTSLISFSRLDPTQSKSLKQALHGLLPIFTSIARDRNRRAVVSLVDLMRSPLLLEQ